MTFGSAAQRAEQRAPAKPWRPTWRRRSARGDARIRVVRRRRRAGNCDESGFPWGGDGFWSVSERSGASGMFGKRP